MLRVIGIDPGSRKTGIGIVDYAPKGRVMVLVYAKVLRFDLETGLSDRLGELAFRLQEILAEYRPDQAVLEDVFVGDQARSALILGQARGACLAVLGLAKTPVTHMAPRKVKLAVTGSGQATKTQLAEMVRVLLKLKKRPAEDAADALGLALSCILAPSVAVAPGRTGSKSKKQALFELAKSQGLI